MTTMQQLSAKNNKRYKVLFPSASFVAAVFLALSLILACGLLYVSVRLGATFEEHHEKDLPRRKDDRQRGHNAPPSQQLQQQRHHPPIKEPENFGRIREVPKDPQPTGEKPDIGGDVDNGNDDENSNDDEGVDDVDEEVEEEEVEDSGAEEGTEAERESIDAKPLTASAKSPREMDKVESAAAKGPPEMPARGGGGGGGAATASNGPSPYAYVFLLVGCDAAHPEASYGFPLSSIYVAVHLLRKYGSTQDVILYVMMAADDDEKEGEGNTTATATTSSNTADATTQTLRRDEFRVLAELGVTVRQIPSVRKPTFHRVMLQKFRVLGLTQYRRVLFLDCDVMPLMNLDLFFELSDPAVTSKPLLQENLIFLDYVSPANGGTFMLSPRPGDLEFVYGMLQESQLIRNQGVEGKEPWRQFQPDKWRGFQKRGTKYDFHAVSGDQGLLWSWVRHYRRRFSYVVKDGIVENYVPSDGDNTSVRLESVIANPFAPDHLEIWPVETSVWGTKSDFERRRRARPPPKPNTMIKPHKQHLGAFGSFFHFFEASGGKPWNGVGCSLRWDALKMPASERGLSHAERAQRFWCQTYHELALTYNLSLPASALSGVSKYDSTYHPSIGLDMWATPGPVTDLLEPDFDPLLPRRKANA